MKQTEFAKVMSTLVARGEPFAVATVIRTEGSSLGKPGFKVIISSSGEALYGSLGGACPESVIVPLAKQTMRTGASKTVKVYLENVDDSVRAVLKSQSEDEIHVETNCGGMMEIYLEPYLPPQRLVLIGQGGKDEVEDALVRLGKSLDFEVVVIDHSPVLSEKPDQLLKDLNFRIEDFGFSDNDSVVVLTKGERDVETLQALSGVKLRYVGLLGSRQRVKENAAKLRESGVKEEFIAALRAPVGADIGAVTSAEIALSIMAEIVAEKYGKRIPGKSLEEGSKARQIQKRAS